MNETQEIKDRVKSMIVENLFLDVLPEEIEDKAPLMETYDIDSVALFELVVGLEDEFDIHLEDTDFSVEAFENVNTITRLVQDKLDEEA